MKTTRNFHHKHIADCVHGTIGLSELEVDILATPSFQRLRNVGQLGLAHFVYPGANYSRLSHSIGVCYVMGRMLKSVNRFRKKLGKSPLGDDEMQLYRLAGLLHDVGHYAFSHTTEHACKPYYKAKASKARGAVLVPEGSPDPVGETSGTKLNSELEFINHEKVSSFLVNNCKDIASIIKKHDLKPDEVSKTFCRESPETLLYTNLISSDLDADRLDYLARTAHHTGLPYGRSDRDYLLNHIREDSGGSICLSSSAARTAEHFLIGRYFDYRQICYHKSVAGLETVLEWVIRTLIDNGAIDFSRREVEEQILAGTWADLDDSYLLQKIRAYAKDHPSPMFDAIIKRKPPKMVYEAVELMDKSNVQEFQEDRVSRFDRYVNRWVEALNIPRDHFFSWKNNISFTKAGGASLKKGEKQDSVHQGVSIIDKGGKSRLLSESKDSIIAPLFTKAMAMVRVYVVLRPEDLSRGQDIEREIASDMR